jgi:hypothetical protein
MAFAGGCVAEQKAAALPSAGVPYDPFVTLTVSKDATTGAFTVKAVPYVAVRPPGSNVKWNIVQQPVGYSIEIEFAATNGLKGPFPKTTEKDNPALGRYTNKVTAKNTIETAPSKPLADTSWKYTVVLRDASDNDVALLDPIVIFK